jgi:hypothetical protein
MKKRKYVTLLCLCSISFFGYHYALAGDGNSFKKNRIKQLSPHSERYNYYEERNNEVVEGSKELLEEDKGLGLDTRELKGYGRSQNWVEIHDSEVGSVTNSAIKRIKGLNPFRNKKKNVEPDNNLGTIAGASNRGDVDNTVIIKNSRVENAILGADVNTGITVKNSNGRIQGKKYTNDVNMDSSRVGGAAGLFR